MMEDSLVQSFFFVPFSINEENRSKMQMSKSWEREIICSSSVMTTKRSESIGATVYPEKIVQDTKRSQKAKKSPFHSSLFRFNSPIVILAILLIFACLFNCSFAAKDYYKVMGVDRQADERTIKRAYRVSTFSLFQQTSFDA